MVLLMRKVMNNLADNAALPALSHVILLGVCKDEDRLGRMERPRTALRAQGFGVQIPNQCQGFGDQIPNQCQGFWVQISYQSSQSSRSRINLLDSVSIVLLTRTGRAEMRTGPGGWSGPPLDARCWRLLTC